MENGDKVKNADKTERQMICSKALAHYMKEKNKYTLSVEVASSNASDFEVTEMYFRLVNDSSARYLTGKRRYRSFAAFCAEDPDFTGQILLPPYRLHIAEQVKFDIKKIWLFHKITAEGIEL